MVRETRHLWVGNLPENIREDRIRDHFKRYGRVQSVKLLPRAKDDEGSGACATVSFMDIKSASKAHNNEQKLEDRTLTTEYHEPAAIPGSGAPIYSSQRFSHGPPEEISSFERSSHFYERERDRRDGDVYLRRTSSTYHVPAAEPLRGRTRDRHYRNGPYAPVIESVVSRQPAHHRSVGSSWSYDTPSRYPQSTTTPDIYTDDRRDMTPVVVVHKKHAKSRSGSNGSESGSNSGSSVSRSRSSSSSSQSGSSSCSSASSSPVSDKSCSTHSHHGSLRSGVTLQSAVSTPHTNNSSPAVHSDDRRPLAICVRNLPARSSDTSLKDGLFHEYKKHGKVTWVKVVGQGSDRYALVCFKKPEDVEKALQVSHDKLFFGCKIEVAPYQGYDVDDNEFRFVARPYEAEQDEFHPKATRTLFIGNLEKDITAPELRKHFDQFGEIIEIDIKKQGSNSSYAFCQYCDIGSVVRAMRTLDGEHLGNNRIKLGFGKSLHTNVVWVDGVAETVTEKYLSLQFNQFGTTSHVAIDRSRGHALVFFDQIAFAQSAVKEMRGVALRGRKLQVDFASRECQEAFYDHLEKQTGHTATFENRSYSRGTTNNAASPSASPSTPARSTPRHITSTPRFDFSSSDYIPERRPYRSYEEMSLEDGGGMVTVTVGQGPQDIRHLQKERVALLEQLEDCASSGEEGSSRRRCKHRRSHSGEGSRPGTPLCDERPENLPPVEPRRTPRERPPDPLSLPLPRFATQLMSPRPAPPSPPASPPRPQSSSSDDSEPSPPSPEWEERLRSLDEKYEKWSGSRSVVKVDPTTLRVRHKLLDLDVHELQPSDIVKSVLARRSVFDEDSKRLENFGEKYEPREFVPTRSGFTTLRPRIDSPLLHSPAAPKSPAAGSSPAGAKGLQYPFPSHPPVQPTTSVATTTAAMTMASCSSLSSGITTVSSNICPIDTSKSPQTFPTTCISSVSSVRQFQTPTSTFQPPPKISSLTTLEKKLDSVDTITRVSCSDKLKSCQKPLPITPNTEKPDILKKDSSSAVQTLLKPLKSCLVRRESGDERRDSDGRRRSREEDAKLICISKSESEKTKDSESVERRRSCSDPRRRDSVDSNKDSSRSDSVSDKLKDRNYKEERRRRDSVDISARKDTDVIDTFKSKLSDSRVSEHSDVTECSKLTDSFNCTKINDTRLDDNLRHIPPTDTSEKNKDSIQVCPERDRRRGRDSVDSCSDSSRHRKVPENLDNKRELESDTRQKDNTDKSECSFKKSLEYIERRKDSGHTEITKPIDLFDRRREKGGDVVLENTRHKEKKDQISKKDKEGLDLFENPKQKTLSRKSPNAIDSLKYKDDKSKVSNPETMRPRENNIKDSESYNEQSQKCNETILEEVFHNSKKHKEFIDSEDSHNMSNCVTELEPLSDDNVEHHKEIKKESDSCNMPRHKDKHHDYSKNKEGDNKKDPFVESSHNKLHIRSIKDENFDLNKQNTGDYEKSPDVPRHSVQSSYDYSTHRFKDYSRRKDEEKVDVKSKNVLKNLHNDIIENCRLKYSEKERENETTNQISEWVEEIRKDLESSGYGKNRSENEFNQLEPENKSSIILTTDIFLGKKKNDSNVSEEMQKEDKFGSVIKDSGKTKLFDSKECINYERRRSNETSEIFHRKETSEKKDFNHFDSIKSNDLDRRSGENDFSDSLKHNILERKKDSYDRDIHKDAVDYINESRHKDWMGSKYVDRKPSFEKDRKANRDLNYSEKEEPNLNDKHKDDSDVYDTNFHDAIEHLEEDNVRKNDCLKKDKKKDRLNSWPAAIGCKRRLSSQDSFDVYCDDSKKNRPERRDSKDSGRSSSSSSTITVSKKVTTEKHMKSYTKLLEDKIKEDKEKEIIQKRKEDEMTDKAKVISRKEKRNSGEKRKDDRKGKSRPKENGITASESEAGSGDDESKTPKRHSIFDIVDEEPAYISMYDKVKARSTKNMQKLEEEKRQERLKEKFNQLKQSRAKREEKKRSTSYDEDSDSERGGRRSNKLMITSSEEDGASEGDVRTKGRKIMSDTSEDDSHKHQRLSNVKPLRFNSEDIENKARKIMSDTSEDDTHRINIAHIKVSRNQPEDLEPKLRKILSDTSEDDIMKHNISRNKPSRIQSDESEVDLLYEDHKKRGDFIKKSNNYAGSDVYSNISEDPIHPTNTDTEKEINENRRNSVESNPSEQPRKKSHKKKQKRQKNLEDNEDGSSKRHSSKKDRRKSSHSHDGDEDQMSQSKIRKKKSDKDNSSKREDNMEEIFGPMSDDSDNIHNKWQVSQIYGSDSDEEKQIIRKRDKRRKERKARELLEVGSAIEAKLMDNSANYPTEEFTKTKKKKRKKSRDEKASKHHQQRLDEEAAAVANEADSEREPEPIIPSPSLPRLMDSPPTCLNQNKKPDIPGFGSQVDENIHETAVKSISESPTKPVEEKREPIDEPMPPSTSEDKPTPVISQEETEDAVAALLLEDSFGGGSFESYTKADTPVSEPDLQIDTDTEDTYDPIDFSRPPRTPDIPTSFYRQQDTREGLEERILPLACPDNASNKDIEQSGKSTSPLTVGLNESNRSEEDSNVVEKSPSKTEPCSRIECNVKNDKIEDENRKDPAANQSLENSITPIEGVRKHELPPLVCQNEVPHVKAIKVNYSEKSQTVPEPNLPNKPSVKLINAEKPLVSKGLLPTSSSSSLIDTKTTIVKSTSSDVQSQFNVTLSTSSQTESSNKSQIDIVNTTQHDYSRSKIIYAQSSVQESNSDKSQIKSTNVTVSQIIVSPPTSVALIVQTQAKIGQTNQQNNSVVQLAKKLHSPVSQQVDLKGNPSLPQYVLHHTLQPTQILASQPTSTIANIQQSGPSNQGAQGLVHQANMKLSVPTIPVSAKSPGLSTSSKSPGLPIPTKSVQDQPFKQLVINNPHSQQLSVNVSHQHHINANLLLSPNQQGAANQSTTAHHSPATLSFSPHHIKVSLAQQSPTVQPGSLQLSPNVHKQISPLSPHQQKSVLQHSPAPQQQSLTPHLVTSQQPNKSNSPLLQQATNCIGSPPVKLCSPTSSTAMHTIRHTSPASQTCQINKISAHVLQSTAVQQVRAVVLQNPAKQTVTLLQQQVGQKPPMIRPINAPQPQVVHTLKSDPPMSEKNKLLPENASTAIVKNEMNLSNKQIRRSSEDFLPLPVINKDDLHISSKLDKGDVENKNELINQTINMDRHIVKPPVEEVKPLNAVIQDLTHKATQAKHQIASLCNKVEEQKSDVIKPLDQFVQEIHDRKKASLPSKLVKSPDSSIKVEQNIIISESEIKTDTKESTLELVNCKLEEDKLTNISKDELKEPIGNVKEEKSSPTEDENHEHSKSLEVKNEINKCDPVIKHIEQQPKVEKIRIIKKEENGLCVDAAPSSSSEGENPSIQVKNENKPQLEDASNNSDVPINKSEECKSEQDVIKGEQSAMPTRGRGGRRRKASGRAGGVLTRRARLNNSAASSNDMSSADIYEFRDDSEEEANRPRLILTIKSPPELATSLAQTVAVTAPVGTSVPVTASPPTCATTTAASVTVMSTTISQANNSSTRKSRRLQEKDGSRNTVDDTIEDVIRGTRSGARRTTRASANYIPPPTLETRKSPRRKQSMQSNPLPLIASSASEVKPMEETVEEAPPSSPQPVQTPLPPSLQPSPQAQLQPDAPPAEPMTLIDPVTGLLIPMRESEEGQYIPVNADHVRPTIENKEDSGEPAEKRMRTALPTEVESNLPTRPGIPVKVPPNCAVVPPLPPKTMPKGTMSMDLSRPIITHSKPAIVTKTTGIVVPSGIPRPTCSLPVPVAINKPLTISAPSSLVKGVMMSPTGLNSKASVTNVVGPLTINNRVVVSPALSPSSKPVAPNISSNTPLNHKTHLLQAVVNRGKVPVAKVPTPMTPKAHILHSMSNVVGREGMVLPGTPPPPHHGVLLTGSVASPPLRAPHHASQQPVVTGASTRVVCKGMLDPVKVEPGSCIVVPSATPQSRSQVMQAGLPVPAFEASIGDVVQHVNFPPHHLQPAHYVHHSSLPAPLYHQYLREAALTSPYHIPGGVKSELEEAVTGGSPPLELRRGSPHDRATDSPTVYVHAHPNRHVYYEPPPAHRPSQPRLQVTTPPHASQVPPQADSLLMLLQRYPVMWQGLLALKTDQAAVQMHFVFGNPHVARDSLPCNSDGSTPPLRIAQRMRLEQTQVEGVARKMQMDNEHCMLLALPCGRDHLDVLQQSNNLQSGFITYLQQKQAAGIINIAGPGSQQAAYVVHIFPSCDFANESLARIAPDLLHRVANIAHLLIVIATV